MIRTPQLLSLILLLKGALSFSQSNYELFTIDTDTTFNTRFDRLEERMYGFTMSADLKVYRDDLRTVVGVDEPKSATTPNQYTAENVNTYTLRNENGDHFISPTLNGKTSVWISFKELKKAFNNTEDYQYIEDLFLKHSTRVGWAKNVHILQRTDMENGMESFHREVQDGLWNGTLTAYQDPQFRIELPVSQIRGRSTGVDTQLSVDINTGEMDTSLVVVTRFPTSYKYLYDCALVNGKITRDNDFPIAFAPMDSNMHGGYYVYYWVRSNTMTSLLPQWRREMIKGWEKGDTGDYLVQRLSVSYNCLNHDPDSLWLRHFIEKCAGLLQEGKLTAYGDRAFMLEMTVSQTASVLNGKSRDYVYEPGELDYSVKGSMMDWIGLDEYHYRADDHSFTTFSHPVGISFGHSANDCCVRDLFLYLPEVKGVIPSSTYDSLLILLHKKIKIQDSKVAVDSLGHLTAKDGKSFTPVNLPEYYWNKKDSLGMKLEVIYNRSDLADVRDSVYVISIGEQEQLPPPKMLVPYLVSGTGSFPSGTIFNNIAPTLNIYDAGYCDENGVVRIPLHYGAAEPFSEGRGLVTNFEYGKYGGTKHCGFLDRNGSEIIPLVFSDARSFSSGMAAVKKDGQWMYIDPSGKSDARMRYEWAGDFNGNVAVVKQDGRYGLINKKGKGIGKIVFDTITSFTEGVALVRASGRWGAINEKGKLIIDTIYTNVAAPNRGSILARDESGESFIYDTNGKLRLDVHGRQVNSVSGDVMVIEQDSLGWKLIGLMDLHSKWLVKPRYDRAGEFSEGILPVRKKERWGFIDSTGKEVIACQYEWVSGFSQGVAFVERIVSDPDFYYPQYSRVSRQSFIDHMGNEVLNEMRPCYLYRKQGMPEPVFKNGLLKFRHCSGPYGYLSHDGREYIYH